MGAITGRDLWYALLLSGVFLGIILFVFALYVLFISPIYKRKKVAQRLADLSEDYMRRVQLLKASIENPRPLLAFFQTIFGRKRIVSLQRHMLQADIYRDPLTSLSIVVLLAILSFFIGSWILRSSLIGVLFGLAVPLLAAFYVKRKKVQKALAVERQMPDAMELMARSLRAGHTLPSAVELLGEELGHPLGTEMRVVYEEQRFGLSMAEALTHLLERIDSQDLRYFVTAVLIQQESGGNLAEIMEKVGSVIRGRLNFKVKIQALTAQPRLSATILIILPVIMFFLLMLIRPQFESKLLTTSTGRVMLVVGVICILMGSFTMRRMIQAIETS